jgi:hypothetical protein
VIAQVYREAGFDPGGAWDPLVRAGLENPDIYEVNQRILRALGVTTLGLRRSAPRIDQLPVGRSGRRMMKSLIGPSMRRRARASFEGSILNHARSLKLIDWSLVAATAERLREEMTQLSTTIEVCKDPQFCWTLPVWLSAGVRLDHVIVTTRPVNEMIASRAAADHLRFVSESDARNALIYALGTVMSCLADDTVKHTIVPFAELLSDPRRVGERLPLPEESRRGEFIRAFTRIVDTSVSRFSS